jgi:putative ABC transport system permease protein
MPPAFLFIRSVLVRDWRFLAVTMASCMVAATVATFQYAVYNSFRQASAVVPRALGPDFWVKAGSVECFDFPAPFSEDYGAALARYLPGSSMRRVVFGFAPWRSPEGRRGNVALVGVEGLGIGPTGFVANRSDFARLDIPDGPASLIEASIGEQTLVLDYAVDTLPTYLGAPYVLADFETARSLLRMDPGSVAFLAGHFDDGIPPDFESQAARAAQRFPDVSIASAEDFASSSINYWERKTGAGLAIGLAAVLALLLMILLLANGVLRFIQRYYADLLSLLGHGAGSRDIGQIVAGVGLAIAAITLMGTAIITPVMVLLFRPLLPWAGFHAPDLLAPLIGVAGALGVAYLSARRALSAFGPDAVFRS